MIGSERGGERGREKKAAQRNNNNNNCLAVSWTDTGSGINLFHLTQIRLNGTKTLCISRLVAQRLKTLSGWGRGREGSIDGIFISLFWPFCGFPELRLCFVLSLSLSSFPHSLSSLYSFTCVLLVVCV